VAERKAKVLVVEDDVDTSDNIKARLQKEGYDTLTCYDGLRALEMIRHESPDVVVLDIMIPGVPGHHICRLLKFDERFQHLPIIVVTGRSDTEYRQMAEKAGADRFLRKPFEISQLLEAVAAAVGGA